MKLDRTLLAAALLAGFAAQAAPTYRVNILTNAAGSPIYGSPVDINNLTQVIVDNSAVGPFVWTPEQKGVSIRHLIGDGSTNQRHVTRINNAGWIIGQLSGLATDNGRLNSWTASFLWHVSWDDQTVPIPAKHNGLLGHVALALNDRGQFGGHNKQGNFLWSGDSGFRSLTLEPKLETWFKNEVNALNNHGVAAGTVCVDGVDRKCQAVAWDAAGKIRYLPENPYGFRWSEAFGINDAGYVVGWAAEADSYIFRRHAVVWAPDGRMHKLGVPLLPGYMDLSKALDINARGQIVGNAVYNNSATGFAWDPDAGLINLSTSIDPSDPAYAKTRVVEANAINDKGEIAAVVQIGESHYAAVLAPVQR